MQLVAYGAQDIYLTGNPMITYFKVVYRRHTNFAMECIEQTFNGNPTFGSKVSALIARNGDLISGVTLQATLPNNGANDRWTENVGHYLIKNVAVSIGGQQIDKQYGDWLEIWSQLTVPAGQKEGYKLMIGQYPKDALGQPTSAQTIADVSTHEIHVPLQFWFCRNVGLALPLIALQYHEVKIDIEFETRQRLSMDNGGTRDDLGTAGDLTSVGLWVDYIYLDTDERRRFAQVSHEYLIEQLQFTGDETVSSGSEAVSLNFNHPVKELIWVTRETASENANQWCNYTTGQATSSVPITNVVTSATDAPVNANSNLGIGTGAGAVNVCAITTIASIESQNFQTGGAALGAGINPTSDAKLQLNGHDRFAKRNSKYFNMVQPKCHHTNVPESPGINVYSFALKPEDHQPSGTCNFSRIDNARLVLTNNAALAANSTLKVFAVNYNVLRIMSGMGGLAYSN